MSPLCQSTLLAGFPLNKHCGNEHLYIKPKRTLQKSQYWEVPLETLEIVLYKVWSFVLRERNFFIFCTSKVKGEVS